MERCRLLKWGGWAENAEPARRFGAPGAGCGLLAATRLVPSSARDGDLDRADSIVKTLNAILDRTKVLADIAVQRQDQRTDPYTGSDYRRHQHAEGDPLLSTHVIDYTIGQRSAVS